MYKLSVPVALKKAIVPVLTRKVFYGAAISCAVGLGMGVWLQPPKMQYAAAATTVTLPQDSSNDWAQDASVSALPPGQPAADPDANQTASVSPPAGGQPIQVAEADSGPAQYDNAQVAASGDTSRAPADVAPAQVAYVQPQTERIPSPDRPRYRDRDSNGYDAREGGRDNEDDLDAPASPPPWAGQPDRRPEMQDRRWDFRPDGSAVPLPDEGDGG